MSLIVFIVEMIFTVLKFLYRGFFLLLKSLFYTALITVMLSVLLQTDFFFLKNPEELLEQTKSRKHIKDYFKINLISTH